MDSSCKKCHKKVYSLRLEVCDEEQRARVTLFDAAQMLVGCNVEDYIKTTLEKKEESMYYRRLVFSKDKEFKFLVRIDMNNSNPCRSLIAQEIHLVEDEAGQQERLVLKDEAPIIVEEAQPVRLRRKRCKKSNVIHVLEDETPHIVAKVQFVRLQTKRGKETNELEIHDVGEGSPDLVEEA
ncbi:hypothetical protein KY284_008212 [Solanum tuberosum]|nr:hypothetical protein KY284_008212 [Solanum tuberosum]